MYKSYIKRLVNKTKSNEEIKNNKFKRNIDILVAVRCLIYVNLIT